MSSIMPKLTRLLVSVRSVFEAEICRRLGVDWIDLKEPSAGSLGAPALSTALAVSAYLEDFPHRSVALGELVNLDLTTAKTLADLFPVAKVGLSQLGGSNRWRQQLDSLSETIQSDLVPVIYADWKDCQSPSPKAVLDWACSKPSRFVLIDTFQKDGRGLLDHFSVAQLEELVGNANDSCVGVVLAGSLKLNNVAQLSHIPCAAIAIRGAACQNGRDNAIDEQLVRQWVNSGSWSQSNKQSA